MIWRLLFVAALCVVGTARAADPNALWEIISQRCVPHEQSVRDPTPCLQVDLLRDFAVLKDNSPEKPTHVLLIPITRVSGIESPDILREGATNYWEAAWEARHFVAELARQTLARDRIGLAINSVPGRTQNQLHIHVDCVRPDVRGILSDNQYSMIGTWTLMRTPLRGHRYRVMRVAGEDLRAVQPFGLVASGIPGANEHMGAETIVVVGAVFADGSPGFYLLNDSAEPAGGDRASGEELLGTCGDDR